MTNSHIIEELPELKLPPVENEDFLPGPEALFKQAWISYKAQLLTFSGIMLIPALISTASRLIDKQFFIAQIVLQIVSAVVTMLAAIALICVVKDSQQNIDIIESYKRALGKILPNLWVGILVGFVTLGGYALFIIPGILFTIWFSLATKVVIVENIHGMNAVLKSKEYVGDHWLAVFIRIFLLGLVMIFSFVALFIIFFLLHIPNPGEVVNFLVVLFVTPFVSMYHFALYTQLKTLSKGELIFTPTNKSKRIFTGIAIFGVFVIPLFFLVLRMLK